MKNEFDIKHLGELLVEDSKIEEVSARGIINELFPFVFEASSRMSSRAISRWLEGKGVKLSAATIAKALRQPKPYWEELFEKVEPAARTFAEAHGVEVEELLLRQELFQGLRDKPPTLEALSHETASERHGEYKDAEQMLEEEWYALSSKVRETCIVNVEVARADPEPADGEAKS